MSSLKRCFAAALVASLAMFALPLANSAPGDTPGVVYTLGNDIETNRVLAFSRSPDGQLVPAGAFATGGKGTGVGLGSQGALALTDNGRFLLAVNAGSNELSVFSVGTDALMLTDIAPSGGTQPISVTVAHNLVYVLNAGAAGGAVGNISGFYLSELGRLYPLPGSTQPLSGADVGPAQISFGLRGDVLIVTEKNTSQIAGFAVADDGRAGPVVTTPSSGAVPFGFAISSKGQLFVSEAAGSALSSYQLQANGSVSVTTASLINHQGAACWVVLSKDEKYAYTANASTDSISGYRVALDGTLTLLDNDGLTAVAGDSPIDLAVSNNGRFLYSLNAASRTIIAYIIGTDGSLAHVDEVGDLPAGAAGLIAR